MANSIQIEGRSVGPHERCLVIAEGCDNHLGKLEVAKDMARQAKLCGADAIKFQHHLTDEEMLKDGIPLSSNFEMPLYDFLQHNALKLEDHYKLLRFCKEIGILYLCTPFSRKAAEQLHEMGIGAFKIGSGE